MEPKTIARGQHPVSRKNIDHDALKVLYRLHRAGHTAYLVGGGVRDLILGRAPKDFDIGTSARPSQLKRLFRNCRLIGRRFRLAHVHFGGDKIVEVSTFRKEPDLGPEPPLEEGEERPASLLRSDNTFGSPEEDALRRDFTVNGLFYNIGDFSVIDYVGGMEDLQRGLIRTIGDPFLRFQEDPVRMIRAVKFCARLGFKMDRATWDAMGEHRHALERSAAPRVQEEIARLLESGRARRSLELLDDSGLLEVLVPELVDYLDRAERGRVAEDPEGDLCFRLLGELDQLEPGRATRALLYSLMLLPLLIEQGLLSEEAPDQAVRQTLRALALRLGISRRDQDRALQILHAQRKLRQASRKRAWPRAMVEKAHFPESFALMEMSLRAEGSHVEELAWWRERLAELPARSRAGSKDRGGPTPRRRQGGGGGEEGSDEPGPKAGPRRRRRRAP